MVKIVQLKTKIIKKKIWNLCEKLFFTPKHQSFYQLEFNIGKDMWKHINHQKINLLIEILLYFTIKWCIIYFPVEKSV